jgi:hypothetical protein
MTTKVSQHAAQRVEVRMTAKQWDEVMYAMVRLGGMIGGLRRRSEREALTAEVGKLAELLRTIQYPPKKQRRGKR